jgi:membrane associated rhomboid family serine protease
MSGTDFNPVQIVTYMFLHDPSNPMHILFNMFTLWMFGRWLEQVWGSKRFLLFYFVCGIGAAIVQEGVWALTWKHDYISGIAALNGLTYNSMLDIVNEAVSHSDSRWLSAMAEYCNSMVTIGASGAIFGLLLGFAFVFPNMPLYFMFIPVPIKAKYMVIGYGVVELLLGITSSVVTVAHFAHLGGMIFGLILLLYWRKKYNLGGGRFS